METTQRTPSSSATGPRTIGALKAALARAATSEHGERQRYLAGCRCDACKQANAAYERARRQARLSGEWNGLVSARKVRAHLKALSKKGVGRRAVAAASDVPEGTLNAIQAGKQQHLRAQSERRILAVTVDMASDHALIDIAPTLSLLRELKEAGFSQRRVARELGRKQPSLQLSKSRITPLMASRIAKVHRRLMASDEALVPAGPTHRRLTTLREELFTERQIARWLDMPDERLNIPTGKIPLALERRVAELYNRLMF